MYPQNLLNLFNTTKGNLTMKNRLIGIFIYWAVTLIPFIGVFEMGELFGAYWFVSCMLIYALIYRPLVAIFRLLSLRAIEEKDAWKLFIPFYHTKFFKTLWFG